MDEMLDEKQDTATLTVKIAQQDPTTVTRSVTETIRNVNILVFNAQGNLIGSTYNDSAPTSVSVPVRISSGCTICAIANTGSSTYFDGISTLTELKAKATIAVTDPTAIADIMYGEQSSVNITSSMASQDIKVKRLYSKYTFTIIPPSDVTITGYQLCNVPNECYIASGKTANPTTGFGGLSYGAVTTSVAAGATVTAGPYYIYENLAGTNPALNTAELRTSGNATSGASYLLINAQRSYWKSTYRIYLGGVTNTASPSTDFTNFNIYRDLNYQCNISLSSNGSKGDARVTYTAVQDTRASAVTGTATVGNYLYSDGTTGTSGTPPTGKTVVGIVFSNQLSSAEYSAGYTHGYALALKDASGNGPTWGPSLDAGLTNVQVFSAYYNDITAGYYGTFVKHYDKNNSNYPAWQAANNYNVDVSGFKNSGWYLPSIGQWWDVCANLGKVNLTSEQAGTSGSGYLYSTGTATTNVNAAIKAAVGGQALTPDYYYWSASEYSPYVAAIVFFNTSYVYLNNNLKYNTGYYVRAVLAF
jgi:hypothetical protein